MCDTSAVEEKDFDDVFPEYFHFDFVRKRSSHAKGNSGGVTVLVKNELIQTGLIKRIFHELEECVVLFFNGSVLS